MSTIRIKQTRSAINRPANQKATIKALGFRKLNQEIEFGATKKLVDSERVSHTF